MDETEQLKLAQSILSKSKLNTVTSNKGGSTLKDKYNQAFTAVVPETKKVLTKKEQQEEANKAMIDNGEKTIEAFKKRGQEQIDIIESGAKDINEGLAQGGVKGLGKTLRGVGEAGLNTVGNVAKGVGDLFGAGFRLLSPKIQKTVNDAVERGGQAFMEGTNIFGTTNAELLKTVMDTAEKNPHLAKDLESVINIATLGAGSATEQPIKKAVTETIENVAKGAKENAPKVLKKVIEAPGAVKEAVSGKFSPTMTSDEIAGQIAQGKTADIPVVKRTLESIDTTGIETQKQLADKLASEIKPLAEQVDAELSKDTNKYKLKDLVLEQKTKTGKVVKTNYVDEALNHLEELYTKTGDNVSASEIQDLIKSAKKEGLTYKEVNDISRKYNSEFGDKAFSKVTGDPLTSINAQKFENVRTGLKGTARKGIGGEEAKYLDSKLSDLYDTKKLIDKQVEAVNKEIQATSKTGFIQKAVRKLIRTADTLTGSPLKSIAKEIGFKDAKMSAVEIQDKISKGLKMIKKNKALSEQEIESKLMEIFKDVQLKVSKTKK